MSAPASTRPIHLLVVAGEDPSGAGLAADRDALEGLGLEARFVATAHTLQDERGLVQLGAREPESWLAEALAGAPPPAALKLGLLPGPAHAAAAARLIEALERRRGAPPCTVLDPVIAPSRGGRFLDEEGVRALVETLGPCGPVLTPNLPELVELAVAAGGEGALEELERSVEARARAARRLVAAGFSAVVVKGGHGREDPVLELVALPEGVLRVEHPRLAGRAIRGSGCRFATRLAAGLALGEGLELAVRRAGELVLARLGASGRSAGRLSGAGEPPPG